ncbi:MAG: Protein translocase subunit secA [Candidatus Magnetoglobus multicellularis str. Araruama]|uniref:Protein translocase subunit secA n=1 Tax=Candidatus Magnetoglobus multicellularis str. Araruama TaxID=890399 RepID=A0A1V1PD36_9BACT|nr:MAG: Protein translocase subunit secA [Candidatus Magnetoglobus multicellularis str. Araruama]
MSYLTEAAYRSLGLRPFSVQIMGSLALIHGYLAEMATGEGKTLTAALAAAIAGWKGIPCHIITVNDYLAERDTKELSAFYTFCGLTTGHVIGPMTPEERRINYRCDVVYTTSKEILADFLRDRLKLGNSHHPGLRLIQSFSPYCQSQANELVMRGLHTAIVDEADSVLIDEAVTPLIISRPMKNEPLKQAIAVAQTLNDKILPDVHYKRIDRYKEIRLTDKGKAFLLNATRQFPGIWRGVSRQEEIIKLMIQAHELFHRDKHYVVMDNKVVIVDEFTGRLMPNRSWSHGLHQAVEAKEGVEITDPMETLARLSFQRFFRFFPQLSGMTGTGSEARGEFWQIYRLPVMTIPTNRPCIRKQLPDRVFSTREQKLTAIVHDIQKIHQSNRPILVGTRNVAASEQLSKRLQDEGLDCQIINAVRHESEAQIVANAGQQKRITIATNMAGRGTDIKPGDGVIELGGLHVIATERHESGRIDRQLFGRCARQGNPGSAQAFISLEDEIIHRFVPLWVQKMARMIFAKNSTRMLGKVLYAHAQKRAEGMAFQQRRAVLHSDKWLIQALSFAGEELGLASLSKGS